MEVLPDIDCDIPDGSQAFVDAYLDGPADEALHVEVLGPFARDPNSNRVWTLAESLEM